LTAAEIDEAKSKIRLEVSAMQANPFGSWAVLRATESSHHSCWFPIWLLGDETEGEFLDLPLFIHPSDAQATYTCSSSS